MATTNAISQVDSTRLEQRADVFLSRITPEERAVVKLLVGMAEQYVVNAGYRPYLIAGVGGVLRREDPTHAEDIDIAVVGHVLQRGSRSKYRSYTFAEWGDLREYVLGFFQQVKDQLGDREKIPAACNGSVPERALYFEQGSDGLIDKGVKGILQNVPVTVISRVDVLGNFGSFGLKTYIGNTGRPIDVQFVFDYTLPEWKRLQEKCCESTQFLPNKSKEMFYAPLAASR